MVFWFYMNWFRYRILVHFLKHFAADMVTLKDPFTKVNKV